MCRKTWTFETHNGVEIVKSHMKCWFSEGHDGPHMTRSPDGRRVWFPNDGK